MKVIKSSIKIQHLLQKFLILLIIVSCASKSTKEESSSKALGLEDNNSKKSKAEASLDRNYKKSFVTMVKPFWFKTLKKFQLQAKSGEPQPHMFYDVLPRFEKNKNTLNFIVTTPEGASYGHDLDLPSGQLFVNRKFCPMKDSYNKTNKEIYKPPFTLGIVPRIMDQLNTPQKIIVFGDKSYYQEFYQTNFFEARIIGAYIEQTCPIGSCLVPEDWLSRMVLIGVKPDSDKYSKIKNVNELVKVVDWAEVVGFIENGQGSNLLAKNSFPGYRMGALVDASQALYFLGENSIIIGNDKLKETRTSCYKLYEYLYRYLNLDRENFKDNKKNKVKKNKIYVGDEKASQKAAKDFVAIEKTIDFNQRFIRTFVKYNEEYKTCLNYIYTSNINTNHERHWFFSFYNAYHLLHDLGYYYDCSRENWVTNPYVAKGKRAVSVENQFRDCTAEDIDRSMQQAVLFLDNLKNKRRKSYRYVDYDNYPFGTHNKIYNWVKFDNKYAACTEDKNNLYFRDKLRSFPKEIKWKKRIKKSIDSNVGEIIE
jgi:hypothetical protein